MLMNGKDIQLQGANTLVLQFFLVFHQNEPEQFERKISRKKIV